MEKFWKFLENLGKKSIFISLFSLGFIGFLFLFSAFTAPLPFLKSVSSTDVAVGIFSLLFLFIFGFGLTDIASKKSSYYNNMNRITRRINKVLTGDRVAWRFIA